MTKEEKAIQAFSRKVLRACESMEQAFRAARTTPRQETRLEAYAKSYWLTAIKRYAEGSEYGGIPKGLLE